MNVAVTAGLAACFAFVDMAPDEETAYLLIEPPAESERACQYRRDPAEERWIWFMATITHLLRGPLCRAIYPGWNYARLNVGKGELCPAHPPAVNELSLLWETTPSRYGRF